MNRLVFRISEDTGQARSVLVGSLVAEGKRLLVAAGSQPGVVGRLLLAVVPCTEAAAASYRLGGEAGTAADVVPWSSSSRHVESSAVARSQRQDGGDTADSTHSNNTR